MNYQERNPRQKAQHVWLYTELLQAWKGEPSSSVFSTDGTLISVSETPHCGDHCPTWSQSLSIPRATVGFFVTFVRLCPTSGSRLLPHACKTLGFCSSLAPIALCTQEQKSDKQTRWFSHWSLLIYKRIGTICCRQAFACLSTVSISLTSTATCKIQSANSRLFSCPVECFRDDLHKNRYT